MGQVDLAPTNASLANIHMEILRGGHALLGLVAEAKVGANGAVHHIDRGVSGRLERQQASDQRHHRPAAPLELQENHQRIPAQVIDIARRYENDPLGIAWLRHALEDLRRLDQEAQLTHALDQGVAGIAVERTGVGQQLAMHFADDLQRLLEAALTLKDIGVIKQPVTAVQVLRQALEEGVGLLVLPRGHRPAEIELHVSVDRWLDRVELGGDPACAFGMGLVAHDRLRRRPERRQQIVAVRQGLEPGDDAGLGVGHVEPLGQRQPAAQGQHRLGGHGLGVDRRIGQQPVQIRLDIGQPLPGQGVIGGVIGHVADAGAQHLLDRTHLAAKAVGGGEFGIADPEIPRGRGPEAHVP